MNPRRLLALVSLVAVVVSPAALLAAPIAAESKIAHVTVYAEGAIVTREALVDLPAGSQEILFAGLPDSIDADLLQVSGDGTAKATILDVTSTTTHLVVPANPRLNELQNQLRALQADLRKITDRATVLQQQRDYLDRIKNVTTVPPTKDSGGALPAIDQWEKLVTFYSESIGRVLGELQDIDRQREDAQARIAAVQAQIANLRAPAERTVQNVTVRVDVATAGTMTVKLAYTVDEASWSPSYDVRVTSADKSIALSYAALVHQSSGEDWKAVKLILSTARPSVGGTAPTLSPWYVDQAVAVPMQYEAAKRAIPSPSAANFATGAAAADKVELSPFEVATASVEAGLTSATFTIANPADIPADNAPHKVVITTTALTGTINHLAVPKLAESAYLRAMVTNGSEFPLIGGAVNLFLDGNFVARSTIKTVMPAEKFVLDLGVDDGITIKRKLLNRLTESAGWVAKRTKITYDVLITVQNNRKTAETVIVKDQLPISRNEKILVELVAPPLRDVRKDDDGTITWTLELKPGEKREIPLKISVDYPVDFQIGGLD